MGYECHTFGRMQVQIWLSIAWFLFALLEAWYFEHSPVVDCMTEAHFALYFELKQGEGWCWFCEMSLKIISIVLPMYLITFLFTCTLLFPLFLKCVKSHRSSKHTAHYRYIISINTLNVFLLTVQFEFLEFPIVSKIAWVHCY